MPQCRRGTWALAVGSNSVIKMIGVPEVQLGFVVTVVDGMPGSYCVQ